MYDELTMALRTCVDKDKDCSECPYYERCVNNTSGKLAAMVDAADAIEELQGKAKILERIADKWCDAVPKWIPVTERLPEQRKQVLVTGIEAIGNVRIYGVKQLDGDMWRPTSAPSCYWEHWMPLPEPPKEE